MLGFPACTKLSVVYCLLKQRSSWSGFRALFDFETPSPDGGVVMGFESISLAVHVGARGRNLKVSFEVSSESKTQSVSDTKRLGY